MPTIGAAKGHIVHCLEGEVENQLITGESTILTPGMTYVVTDDASQHRSYSKNGVKLLILIGDFLKAEIFHEFPATGSAGSGISFAQACRGQVDSCQQQRQVGRAQLNARFPELRPGEAVGSSC